MCWKISKELKFRDLIASVGNPTLHEFRVTLPGQGKFDAITFSQAVT